MTAKARDDPPRNSANSSTPSRDVFGVSIFGSSMGLDGMADRVDPVFAEHCRVEMIKDGVLIVSVPSGAFAHRSSPTDDDFEQFFPSRQGAPTSMKTVLNNSKAQEK